jgi:Na+/glutamate symporter
MLKLNLIHTGAFSGIVLFIGYGLGRVVRPLESLNIPAPVVGGLVIALMTLKLWELAGLMLPLFIILLGQIVLWARPPSSRSTRRWAGIMKRR